MLAIDLTIGETTIGPVAPRKHSGIIALLGLTGERSGSGQFSCDQAFGCRIASQMLMAEYATVDADVLDAISEIANMIVGSVKNSLESYLGPMGLSTPMIVSGCDFDTRIAGNADRICMTFTSGDDVAAVQVVLAPRRTGLALAG